MQLSRAWRPLSAILLGTLLVCYADRSNGQAAKTSLPATAPAAALDADEGGSTSGTETVVFLRHAEKPPGGLGQLTPQGLNRAIALSTVLPDKFGKPDYLFAPDPIQKVAEGGSAFNYVRPLATIEPTAILLGMPVQTPCGFAQIDRLDTELVKPKYARATIFVAWEHAFGEKAAARLMDECGGNGASVPHWHGADFDSLYVVKIVRNVGQPISATFTLDHEGLNNLSKSMPVPAR